MDEIDNTDSKTQTERMNKLHEHQKNILAASMNVDNELETFHNTTNTNTNIENTKNNIIRQFSATIAQLEARVRAMEDKDRNNTIAFNKMEERINQIEVTTTKKDMTIHQAPTARQDTNLLPSANGQPVTRDNIDENGFIMIQNRRRKIVPTIGISPGDGLAADSAVIPPITYSRIHLQARKKQPRERIPPELLNMTVDPDQDEIDD